MTQEEIIRMALESGFSYEPSTNNIVAVDGYSECRVRAGLERFAALVTAHECEKQAEQEPVAFIGQALVPITPDDLEKLRKYEPGMATLYDTPLYTHPVRTKDLTDDEIRKVSEVKYGYRSTDMDVEFARAVIAADREKNR